MPRNSSGTYTLPSGNPVSSGTLIEANWANTTLSDLASAMTNSLSRGGEGGMTAALRLFDGTVSSPGLAFTSETSTGLYRAGAGDMRLAVTGSQIVQFLTTGVAVTGTLGASGNFAINTDKFTVAASSGNTVVAGTLGVTGTATLSSTVIATTDNTNAALRITQLGTGNALLVEDSANPDSTPFVIDASGNLVAGYTSVLTSPSYSGSTITPSLQKQATTTGGSATSTTLWSATSASGQYNFNKSRSATIGTYGVVSANDKLGVLTFAGDDGAAFILGATIDAAVDGTPGTNDMPGRLVFSTTADGASSPTERMRIDSSGNINIATAGARITGDFSNATIANRVMFQTSTVDSVTVVSAIPNGTAQQSNFEVYNKADPSSANNPAMGQALINSSEFSLRSSIRGSGTYLPMTFYTNGSERMRIDTSGNVGIGTSSPLAKLQTNSTDGTIAIFRTTSGANNTRLNIDVSDTAATAGFSVGGNSTFPAFTFSNGGAERMRIDSSGNLLVGGNATNNKAPLTVQTAPSSSAYGQIAAFSINSSDVGNAGISVTKYDNVTTTSQIFARFLVNQGTTASGQINANGASAAAFGSYSDRRLKENITDLPSQLANIMALRPVEFDYIESEGGGHQIGFIAQEIKEIYPDLVGEREDGMLTLTDLNKNDARLIKAIQEQQALIQTLTDRITALETVR